MSDKQNTELSQVPQSPAETAADQPAHAGRSPLRRRRPGRMNWLLITLFKAGLFLAIGLFLIAALGLAQKVGWISAAGGGGTIAGGGDDHAVTYTCAMHPQVRQSEPGRCFICAMELVPATEVDGEGDLDELAIRVEPAARRLANIQTATAQTMTLERTIRSIGEIDFDESRLATITAWVDGRIERLFADYTGVKVRKGDHLVHLYSPELYAAQIEYLVARESVGRGRNSGISSVSRTSDRLLDNVREKLRELGTTDEQIRELDESGKAQTRLEIYAPVGGTVIEKPAVEGQYVETGDIIYRIADLSVVWLILELYPDDAAQIRYGQLVEAEVQSLPGEVFNGRVAFVDPVVDPKTRTVGVRVEILNPDGRLRPGDYAVATIKVPITKGGDVYDAELAGKWISPHHPQIIRDRPGKCPICGIALVPTSELGYAEQPVAVHKATVVPRDAVLMAGSSSVVYVETEPGRFEIRPVTLGPMIEKTVRTKAGGKQRRSMAAILAGIEPGETVATSGNFLIDSQMQLAGKPSLIDPTRAKTGSSRTEPGPMQLDYAEPRQLTGATGEVLDEVYARYFAIQRSLAADRKPSGQDVSGFVSALHRLGNASGVPDDVLSEAGSLAKGAEALAKADLETARRQFKSISHFVVRLAAQARGPQTDGTFVHFYCPMVKGGGGDWLQPDKQTANPYFGSQMPTCGEKVHELVAQEPKQKTRQ